MTSTTAANTPANAGAPNNPTGGTHPAAAPTAAPAPAPAPANQGVIAPVVVAAPPVQPPPTPPPPPPQAYVPTFHNGQLPAPTGMVARSINTKATKEEQRTQANNLLTFLKDPNANMLTLNGEDAVYTALVSIPNSHKVRLIYGLGVGTSKLGNTSPIENKFLGLFGEGGGNLGTPQVQVFETSIRQERQVKTPTDAVIHTAFAAANGNSNRSVQRALNCTTETALLQIAPIPAYLLYDGFGGDLDAAVVYERLLDCQHDSPMRDHALNFLRSCLIGSWRQGDEKPSVPLDQFYAALPDDARRWASGRFQELLATAPAVAPLPPAPQGQAPQPPQGAVPLQTGTPAPGMIQLDNAMVQKLLQQLLNQGSSATTASTSEEKKDDGTDWKVSEDEKRCMRIMCGLPSDAGDEAFPRWYRRLFAKHQDSKDKEQIIKEAITTTEIFDDAKVPLYPALIKMVLARLWWASELGDIPAYCNAAKGLSPFSMLNLQANDIAVMFQHDDDLSRATSVSASDIRSTRDKIIASVPEEAEDFLLMRCQFTNFLYALFNSQSPMYKKMYAVVKAVKKISVAARKNMSHQARATILWIILLQARQFSHGNMTVDDDGNIQCLFEFDEMLRMLSAKSYEAVYHGELPDELRYPKNVKPHKGTKRQPDSEPTSSGFGSAAKAPHQPPAGPKKPRNRVVEPYSTELKAMFAQPLKDAGYPSLKRICEYCGTTREQLLPGLNRKEDCEYFLITGECMFEDKGGCTLNHRTAKKAEVNSVATKLKRFFDDPLGLGDICLPTNALRADPPLAQPPTSQSTPTVAHVVEPEFQSKTEQEMAVKHIKEMLTPHKALAMTEEEQKAAVAEAIQNDETIPKHGDIATAIGKKKKMPSLILPRNAALDHPAADLIAHYAAHGCPVDCGDDWTIEHIEAAILRGPHPTADSLEAMKALHEETDGKVKNGYARVVRYGDIRRNLPKNLKISPVAMIPHKSRSFRTILDLSFRLRYMGKLMESVNSATVKQAPAEAMVQLGNCVQRLVALLADNYDPSKPFKFAKLDIKDGFWRMAVSPEDAWNFCYVLPQFEEVSDIDDVLLVVPNCLQMGWCESPPFFCAASETARDVIDTLLKEASLPPHEYETEMMREADTDDAVQRLTAAAAYVNLTEVFVDDFVGATNNTDPTHLRHFSRAMLHGVHSIFPPPSVSGHNGEDPVSQKKLQQGEGTWETTKEILGWLVDGANFTLQLMPDKCEKIGKLIKKICKMRSCPIKLYQELAGKLQHASFAIPGGKGLFSPVHRAMSTKSKFVRISAHLKQTLRDWKALVLHLSKHPTPVQLLVSEYPNYLNYTDACRLGAGGVVLPGLEDIIPYVWQFPWPEDIRADLVSTENPSGRLTINDLELGGLVLGWLVLEYVVADLTFKHVGSFCDNTSAVAWAYKGHTTTSLPAARLLRLLSIRQRERRASSLIPVSIAGKDNQMADVPSRAFKSAKILDRVQNPFRARIASDIMSAWRAAANGVTPQTAKTREKYWREWANYCAEAGQPDPYLSNVSGGEQTVLLTGFAARVRSGFYGKGNRIKVQSVTEALSAITQTCKLDGKPSPVTQEAGEYILPLKRVIEGFRREDPPAIPQLAVPKDVPEEARRLAYLSGDPIYEACGDLAVVAFYYLLRSGEYTRPRYVKRNGQYHRATRTQQFRVKDIGFWKDGKILPRNSSLDVLITADSATMKISNQKNGRVGQTIHHESTGKDGAVASLARRVHHILSNQGNGDNQICDVFDGTSWVSIEGSQMVAIVRHAAKSLQLTFRGIDPDLIGAHSLRAGGAMALKLQGYDDSTIKKFGRWTSNTWEMYIHSQISNLSAGVATKMAMPVVFHNIAYIEPDETDLS